VQSLAQTNALTRFVGRSGEGCIKETTLHSFDEVHPKTRNFISFIYLNVYSYPQINDKKLCKGFPWL